MIGSTIILAFAADEFMREFSFHLGFVQPRSHELQDAARKPAAVYRNRRPEPLEFQIALHVLRRQPESARADDIGAAGTRLASPAQTVSSRGGHLDRGPVMFVAVEI